MKDSLLRKCACVLLPAAIVAIWAAPAMASTFSFADQYYVSSLSDFQSKFGATATGYISAGLYQETNTTTLTVVRLSNGSFDPGEFVQNTTPDASRGLQLVGWNQSLNNAQQVTSVSNYRNPNSGAVLYFRYMTGVTGGSLLSGTTTPFTFNSFDLRGVGTNVNLPFTLHGFLHGAIVDTAILDVTSGGFATFTENWQNVDTVEIDTTASLPVNWSGGTLYMDNVVINNPVSAPTPEPSSLLLLGTGLIGVAGVARRRMNNSRIAVAETKPA